MLPSATLAGAVAGILVVAASVAHVVINLVFGAFGG